MARIAVCLSGCGVYDGSEIHEATATLWAISRRGHQYFCIAPDIPQAQVTNHLNQEPMQESRNVRIESARIARGEVRDVKDVTPDDFDALIFPGGYGAAINLCDFASARTDAKVHPDVQRLIDQTLVAKKPIGAWCIAPAMLAAATRGKGVTLTIGTDKATAEELEKMGAKHKRASAKEVVVDPNFKIVTTPAYMLASNIAEVFEGIDNAVGRLLELCK